MITHELDQGSQEWLKFRLEHDGASEIAAVLGLSKNTTRNELLRIKSTGIGKEFSDYVQRMVLDKGHEIEALARPIVEEIIGEELYPIVASNRGRLSASCDGLTMMENIGWENKQYNDAYYSIVLSGEIPEEHMPQVQQCLLVTGAEKWFFTVSDGTEERTKGVWVYPDQEWFEKINLAWSQFHKDLAEYEYTPVVEPPKAEAIKDLPAVTVHVRGELTLCNINEVTPLFDKFLSGAKTELVTDNDFAQAEAEAKMGRETAKRCKLTAKAVVDQMLSISEVTRTLEEYAAKFDALALKQEKAVREQKEARKTAAKLERDQAYAIHIAALNNEISPIVLVLNQADKPDFVGAMKNQRTLESLYNKLDTELARAKIAADAVAKSVRLNLNLINGQSSYKFLFNDSQQLVYKDFDDLKLLIDSRIDAHKKAEEERIETERLRIKAEEEAKAKQKAEAEQKAKLEAEREKIRQEEQAKAEEKLRAEQAEKYHIEQETKQADDLAGREKAERDNQEMMEQATAKNSDEADNVAADPLKQAEVEHVVERLIDTAKIYNQEKPIKGGNPSVEMVTIPKSEYEELVSKSTWLSCLEDAGVDNWTGIDHAKEMLEELATA